MTAGEGRVFHVQYKRVMVMSCEVEAATKAEAIAAVRAGGGEAIDSWVDDSRGRYALAAWDQGPA